MKAKINGALIEVYEIVDVDADDNRVYLRTFKDGEVFCLHAWDVIVSKQDVEVEPWNEQLDASFVTVTKPEFGGAAWFAAIDPIPYGEVLAIPHPTRPGTLIATYKGLVKLYKESVKK